MKKDKISSAVIRRLPRYYRHLDDLYRNGTVRISSGALAKSMGLTARRFGKICPVSVALGSKVTDTMWSGCVVKLRTFWE